MIIGLSGYARAGKDEAAKGLTAIGFERVGFADKLRDFLYALNPIVDIDPSIYGGIKKREYMRLNKAIDMYGWDGYKESDYGQEIRGLLQRLGTECGRELISDTIWIDAALNGKTGDIVVADCRFPNEAQAIKDRGGYIVRINRPGINPANAHPSETALDGFVFDAVLDNDGDVGWLHYQIRQFARSRWEAEDLEAANHGYTFTGSRGNESRN